MKSSLLSSAPLDQPSAPGLNAHAHTLNLRRAGRVKDGIVSNTFHGLSPPIHQDDGRRRRRLGHARLRRGGGRVGPPGPPPPPRPHHSPPPARAPGGPG